MANTVYESFILESRLNDLLNTKLASKSLMTVDGSLAENAGMIKKINKYTFSGAVETVAEGAANSSRGAITFTTSPYEVEVYQQVADYTDEQAMQDANVVDFIMEGAATTMVNHMNTKFFAEQAKATLEQEYPNGESISYDVVVDAIAKMNLEDEAGLFLVIGTDLKAAIRKDADFKAKELGQIVADGAIGTISGVPVIVSKLVPEGVAYLAHPSAVTLFTKKDSEIEQERDGEKRTNTVIMRRVALCALTDATKVVKIVEAES